MKTRYLFLVLAFSFTACNDTSPEQQSSAQTKADAAKLNVFINKIKGQFGVNEIVEINNDGVTALKGTTRTVIPISDVEKLDPETKDTVRLFRQRGSCQLVACGGGDIGFMPVSCPWHC
jgi:hypothetical protein